MFAVLAAVLALAGAPAGTPFTCHPDALVPPGNGAAVWGLAYIGHTNPVVHVEVYGPVGCAALWYTGASPRERVLIAKLNPAAPIAFLVGAGLLLDLHESTHVALNSFDECLVEKTALAKMPELLARYFGSAFAAEALAGAKAFDGAQPSAYHNC